MTLEYNVPRLLWENMESVLLAQSKRYVSELAKHLRVSEKELLKRVLPTSDSLKVILYDSHAESHQCKAYLQQDHFTVYCRRPIGSHSEYCVLHRKKRMTVIEGISPTIIQKMKDRNTMDSMWIQGQRLLTSNGTQVGIIKPSDQKIKLFVLPDT
jgi:hypothetical protein